MSQAAQAVQIEEHAPHAVEANHPLPTEENITRTIFMIMIGAAVAFISAAILLVR